MTTQPVVQRAFRCACGAQVYLRNSQCVNCGRQLGYCVPTGRVESLEPAEDNSGAWRLSSAAAEGAALYLRCANLQSASACNWLVPAPAPPPEGSAPAGEGAAPAPLQCLACSLNRTLPDLSNPVYAGHWGRAELAKRRLVSSLLGLGLPVQSRLIDDPAHGLAFDFLAPQPGGKPVMTGHDNGIITINLDEADDAYREAVRTRMQERYRTLLGHLRHEVGHYYWDRLVRDSGWHAPYRELFGDESLPYKPALKRHYEQGPPPDWAERCISAYASSHPWEDWAESWAHYLHMVDTMGTAQSFGLNVVALAPPAKAADPPQPEGDAFDALFAEWLRLTELLNELSRSMGQADFYPFIVSTGAREKLRFVHRVITEAAPPQDTAPAPAETPATTTAAPANSPANAPATPASVAT